MSQRAELLQMVRTIQQKIRDRVFSACEKQSASELVRVARDGEGDTIYAIDCISEELLVEWLRPEALRVGGIVLVAEGLKGGELVLHAEEHGAKPRWRMIVDPIDGTRGLMYQKRSAWILAAVAPNYGDQTRLSDVVLAVQTEIPTLKQHLSDELWAVSGQGAHAVRYNRLSGDRSVLRLKPSNAPSIAHGYAMISRFFPGLRDELAAIDEEVVGQVLGPSPAGKALCFEEQYASSGGQLYELMAGHDRFNADLRAIMTPRYAARRLAKPLCCHPYDLCTVPIARELGVIVTDARGEPLDMPLNVVDDVAWVGYANQSIRSKLEPALQTALRKRGLL